MVLENRNNLPRWVPGMPDQIKVDDVGEINEMWWNVEPGHQVHWEKEEETLA
jgi:hypothetical protein